MVERNTLNVVVKGSIPLLGVYVATGPHSWAFAPFSPFSGPSLPPDLSRLAERTTLNRVVMGSIPILGANSFSLVRVAVVKKSYFAFIGIDPSFWYFLGVTATGLALRHKSRLPEVC